MSTLKSGSIHQPIINSYLWRYFLIISVVFTSLISHAQTQNPYVPKVVPPSPNAASLMKFSDIPVSYYTGAADITVPIYTISAKDISVPVSLSYHTGGIRQKEDAGWVGLGWALNAGGCISRNIMDQDDLGGNYFNKPVPEITANLITHPAVGGLDLGYYTYDMFCDYNVYTDQGTKSYAPAFQSQIPLYDMEPDIYNYNFPGHSGKFMITRDKKVLIQKQENIIIELKNDNNNAAAGYYFKITDENGNVYLFKDNEYTYSSADGAGAQKISSWYLSEINSQKNETIHFNYWSDGSWASQPGDKSQTYRWGCFQNGYELTTTETAYNLYWNITLSSINFENGQLQFLFDNSRSDIANGKRLNQIKLYSKDAAANLKYLWEYQLNYSYFNQNYPGSPTEFQRLRLDKVQQVAGSENLSPYIFSYIEPGNAVITGKRSYSIDHWGYCNGATNSFYLIPPYHGVYSPPGSKSPPVYLTLDGANRDASIEFTKLFSLEKVQYPTGGKTVFEYESNSFDEAKSFTGPVDFEETNLVDKSFQTVVNYRGQTNGTIDLSNIFPVIAPSVTGNNITVWITFRSSANNCCTNYTNKQISVAFNGITTTINNTALTCQGPVLTYSYTDKITSNSFKPYIVNIGTDVDNGFQDVVLKVSWKELKRNDPVSSFVAGGGLRIKTITDYSSEGAIAKKRRWDYSYQEDKDGNGVPETYSYGKRMSPPSYMRYEPMVSSVYYGMPANSGQFYCESLSRFSSSNTSLTSSVQGNAVGYDQVTEYTINPATNQDNGKTVYQYFNSPDTVIYYNGFRLPGLFNMGNSLSGSLLAKTDYKNDNGNYIKVSEAVNAYATRNRICYYSPKYNYLQSSGNPQAGICTGDIGSGNEYLLCFYPSVKSEKILLDNTIETIYDQADNLKKLTTTKKYFYDNPLHNMLNRTAIIDSKGNNNISKQKYPQDYIPNNSSITNNITMDAMISRNMVASVIEKTDVINYAGSSVNYTKSAVLSQYKLLPDGAIDMDRIYKADFKLPQTNFQGLTISNNSYNLDIRYRQMIQFDSYDNQNNINQFTATDLEANSFIWDYKQNYPVAQVKNATAGDIAFTSFESDGNGNFAIPSGNRINSSITGRQSYNLANGPISKAIDNSKTFVVSYWSQNGMAKINGTIGNVKQGNRVTINNIQWTYYEHKVSGVNTVSISIPSADFGSLTIDELRLYPANAQMSSFTYEPLIGITSQCDINNRISYYEYDAFGRLTIIRDQDGNILKKMDYVYYTGNGTTASPCIPGSNCTGYDKKCINGFCEAGIRVNTSTKLLSTGLWKCTFHYEWSNGDYSINYSETTNTIPCPLD